MLGLEDPSWPRGTGSCTFLEGPAWLCQRHTKCSPLGLDSGRPHVLCDSGQACAHLWALVSPWWEVGGGPLPGVCDKPLKSPEGPPRHCHPHMVLLTLAG